MSIIPSAVLTVAQFVSGVVSTAKTARELAKDPSNHELKAIISELYDAVLDVKGRVLDLDEENRHLKSYITENSLVFTALFQSGVAVQNGEMAAQLPSSRTNVVGRNCGF